MAAHRCSGRCGCEPRGGDCYHFRSTCLISAWTGNTHYVAAAPPSPSNHEPPPCYTQIRTFSAVFKTFHLSILSVLLDSRCHWRLSVCVSATLVCVGTVMFGLTSPAIFMKPSNESHTCGFCHNASMRSNSIVNTAPPLSANLETF